MNLNWALLAPELYLLLVLCAVFVQTMTDGAGPAAQKWLPWAGLGAILVSAASMAAAVSAPACDMFWGSYRIDAVSQFFKFAVAVGLTVTMANAVRQPSVDDGIRADWFLFLGLSAWGLMLLASAVELITIYVALEISSYSLYALVPLRGKSPRAAEAGAKYIIFGAAATALALFGFAWILASAHTSYIAELAKTSFAFADAPLAAAGLSLFLVGLFYKLALFPFHFWCPDVYDGAGNETAAYIATLPKLGAVVVLVRLAALLKPGLEVTTILAVLGAVSMTYGNLAALAQKDIKRLLGFSSVAHAGYVMLGLVTGTAQGLAAAVFYSLAYLLMNLACFWVLCRLSTDGRNMVLDDLNGLHRRAPALAFTLAVSAFALVGLPPTAGFMGKLFLVTAAWNHGYDWLVIVAAVNTAISIYYYLGLVRHAYTAERPESEDAAPAALAGQPLSAALVGGILAASILLVGMLPWPLFRFAVAAGKALLP